MVRKCKKMHLTWARTHAILGVNQVRKWALLQPTMERGGTTLDQAMAAFGIGMGLGVVATLYALVFMASRARRGRGDGGPDV